MMSAAPFIRKRPGILIGMSASILFAAMTASIWAYTVDDAYIVFRYARNLLAGYGPVFNPGDRVEGFTSPLWLGLATIAEALHLPADQACKGFSLLAIVSLLWHLANRFRDVTPAASLPLILLATHTPLVVAAVCGLETGFNAVIIVCLLLSAHGRDASSWRRPALWGMLAILCRPENGMLVGLHGAYLWLARPRQRRTLTVVVGLWLVVGLALTLARLAYYGQPIPNTAAAKLQSGTVAWGSGGHYLATWLARYGWFLLLGLPALWSRRARPMAVNGWLLILGQVAFVLLAGGDWMPQWRFLLPASVVLAVLGCHSVETLLSSARDFAAHTQTGRAGLRRSDRAQSWGLDQSPERKRRVLAKVKTPRWRLGLRSTGRLAHSHAVPVGCAALLAAGVVTQVWHFRTDRWALDTYIRSLDELDAGPIRYLARRAKPDDLVVARDVGLLGYRANCRVLDLVGLTDFHIAHTSGLRRRDRIDVAYVFEREPAWLMLQSERDAASGRTLLGRLSRRLRRHADFQRYRLRARWNLPGRQFCEVYHRTDGAPAVPESVAMSVDE